MANDSITSVVELPPITGMEDYFNGAAPGSHVSCIYGGQPTVCYVTGEVVDTADKVGDDQYVLGSLKVKRFNGVGWDDLGFPETMNWTRDDRTGARTRSTVDGLHAKFQDPKCGIGPGMGMARMTTDGTTLWVAVASWETIEYTSIHGEQQIGWKCEPPDPIFPGHGDSSVPKYDTEDDPPEQWWSVASMYVFAYTEGGGWSLIMYRPSPVLNVGYGETFRFQIASHDGAGYCWLASTDSGYRGRHGDYPFTDAIVITTKLSPGGLLEEHYRTQGTPPWWADQPGDVTVCDDHIPEWHAIIHNYLGGYYGPDFGWDDTMTRAVFSDIHSLATDGDVPLLLGFVYTRSGIAGGGGVQEPPEPPPPPSITVGSEILVNGDFSSGMANWTTDPSNAWAEAFDPPDDFALVGGQARIYGAEMSIYIASDSAGIGNVLSPDHGNYGIVYQGSEWKPPAGLSFWQFKFTWQRLRLDDGEHNGYTNAPTLPWGGVGWPVQYPGYDPLNDGALFGDTQHVGYGFQGAGLLFGPVDDPYAGFSYFWGGITSVPDWRTPHSAGGAPIGTPHEYTYTIGIDNRGDGTKVWQFGFAGPIQLYDPWDFPDAPWWASEGFAYGISDVSLKQLNVDPMPIPWWDLPGGLPPGTIPGGPADVGPPPLQAINAGDLTIAQTLEKFTGKAPAIAVADKIYLPAVTSISGTGDASELDTEFALFYPEEVDVGGADWNRAFLFTLPVGAAGPFAPLTDSMGEDVSMAKHPLLGVGPAYYGFNLAEFAAVTKTRTPWFAFKTSMIDGSDMIQLWSFQGGCPLPEQEHGRYAWQKLEPVIQPGWPLQNGFQFPPLEGPAPVYNAFYDPATDRIYVVAWAKYLSGDVDLRCWYFQLCLGCVPCSTGMHLWQLL